MSVLNRFFSKNAEDRITSIEERLSSAAIFDSQVDLIGYTGGGTGGIYIFPSDGYVRFVRKIGSTSDIQFDLGGMNINVPPNPSTQGYFRYVIPVRKGLRFYIVPDNIAELFQVYFYPIKSN